jgi:four helix bundle protein
MLDARCWVMSGGFGRRWRMRRVQSFRDLEVYRSAFELAVEVDRVSKRFPRHEMYEIGSQLRRSAKSIPSNIAEGFGRRRYKQDYVRFIVYALASCDETRVHLDMLHRTGSLPKATYQRFSEAYDILGKRLNRFLQGIIQHHKEPYR